MTKKPFLKAKCRELKQISAKAVVVKSYDGQEDVLPLSQIKEGIDCIIFRLGLPIKRMFNVHKRNTGCREQTND